jgi:hypothetical protein
VLLLPGSAAASSEGHMDGQQILHRAMADAASIRQEVEREERLPFTTSENVSASALLVIGCALLSEVRTLNEILGGAMQAAAAAETQTTPPVRGKLKKGPRP